MLLLLFSTGCVLYGPFGSEMSSWSLPNGECVARFPFGNPPSTADVQIAKNLGSFYEFEVALRVNLHNTVHCLIGKLTLS